MTISKSIFSMSLWYQVSTMSSSNYLNNQTLKVTQFHTEPILLSYGHTLEYKWPHAKEEGLSRTLIL